MKAAIVFLGVLALACGQSTQVNQCTVNSGDLPVQTYIPGCRTPPCNVPQGQATAIEIVFSAPRNIQSMQTYANAFLMGTIGFNYDLGKEADTCRSLTNATCPVKENDKVSYKLNLFIDASFPMITANTEFYIVDENNAPVTCFRVPLRIVAPAPIPSTQVSQCTVNSGDLPVQTYIPGCRTPPCEVRQGQATAIEIVFRAPRNIQSMQTYANAFLMGTIGFNYDLGKEADTCRSLTNATCPVKENDKVSYKLNLFIDAFFPMILTNTEFYIVDENNVPVTCFRVPLRIVA